MDIIAYLNRIAQEALAQQDSIQLDNLYSSVEQLAYAAKIYKDIYRNMEHLGSSDVDLIVQMYTRIRTSNILLFRDLLAHFSDEETTIDVAQLQHTLQQEHDHLVKFITQGFQEFKIDKKLVAMMLNVNQASFLAGSALCTATKLLKEPLLTNI